MNTPRSIHRLRRLALCAAALAGLGASTASFAQTAGSGTSSVLGNLVPGLVDEALIDQAPNKSPAASRDSLVVGTRFDPAASARVLAQRYNADKRAQIANAYVQAFEGYQKIEAQFGIPKGDLAGGVAAFIAGNLIAYRNQDFPDQQFVPLVDQMRNVLSANPTVAHASANDRRQTYEQMAMVGMFMATAREALKRKPNPKAEAEIRQTARTNLEQFLKTDPDRLQITDSGLVIR